MWLYHRVMSPNDADGIANSLDRDQTASLRAVWSGSALFAQAYLSENLGTLQCPKIWTVWLYDTVMCHKDADRFGKQSKFLLQEQSDLGLHCLPRTVCLKIGICIWWYPCIILKVNHLKPLSKARLVGGWVGQWCWVASSAGASYYFGIYSRAGACCACSRFWKGGLFFIFLYFFHLVYSIFLF